MMWRIRLTLSDDQYSRALLHEALADKPVSTVRLEPCGTDKAEITGEVMAEFTPDGLTLAALIEALHMISPQVFVARADRPASPASPEGLTGASGHLAYHGRLTDWRDRTGLGRTARAMREELTSTVTATGPNASHYQRPPSLSLLPILLPSVRTTADSC
jgi:hypothetical protein